MSREIASGRLSLSVPFYPVHLPFDGIFTMDFAEHDGLKVPDSQWAAQGFPRLYTGEDLNGKQLVVFPMHGFGDQLYLAVAIRALSEVYPNLSVTIVRPSIASAEQWYPLIYFESWYRITGPVVTAEEMATFDFYLDAEHFAHLPDYQGTYPPDFYLRRFFCQGSKRIENPLPQIKNYPLGDSPGSERITRVVDDLRKDGRPLVFVNATSTGRVRDLPVKTLVRFLDRGKDRWSFIVSSFKRPDIDAAVEAAFIPHVRTTKGLIASVEDLLEIIGRVDFVVTSDSGVTHLAEALERPCGTVFNVVSPEERVGCYRFCESLNVEFTIPGVCATPCYIHALKEGDLCPGMACMNERIGERLFYDYPPCVNNLEGDHLLLLLESLAEKLNVIQSARVATVTSRAVAIFRRGAALGWPVKSDLL
jgi:hypothetical protein